MKALITGITGQCGSYMAELLLSKEYDVYGMVRRNSTNNTERIYHILSHSKLKLVNGDLSDQQSLNNIIRDVQPDEIYNFAAQSFVPVSFQQPTFTGDVTGLGVTRILEAVKNECPTARFIQASTSEMFGQVQEEPQNENTPFYPRSPYGIAKLYGYWMVRNYRESYGLFLSNAINFNNESPRRGSEFVTRKITQAAVKIYKGKQKKLYLGNLDAERDWSHSADIVFGMWMALQQEQPDDFVFASGEKHTVREFCDIAFNCVNLNYKDYVEINPRFWRPAEVSTLLGDYTKAKNILGWKPRISFQSLIEMMVNNDLNLQEKT